MARKTPVKKEENPKFRKIFDIILLVSFGLLIIFFTTSKLTNEDDYFWHLSTGRYIVQNQTIPSTDVFSYPTEGQPWLVTEWAWDVLTYYVFISFGYLGLSILNTLVFLTIFGLYYLLLHKFKTSYPLIVIFSIVLIFGIFERLTPRPHIISYLFFAVLLYLFVNYKYFDRKNYKKLYIIPVIFLIWANMHMGCIIGIGIFGIFIISEWTAYLLTSKSSAKQNIALTKSELIRLIIIFLISCLAMIINPHGITTYYYAFFSQANTKMLYEAVMEWISPFNPRVLGKFHNVIYIFFLISSGLIIIYSIKKRDFFAGIICILFAVNSIRALRFTIDYLLVSFPFFLISLNYFLGKIRNVQIHNFIFSHPFLKIVTILFIALLLINVPNNRLYHKTLTYARFAGIGLDENYYPVKMFDFIKENKIDELGAKPFNTFECGGFFIWNFPGKKDFFDSRDLNNFIMNEYQTLISKLPGYENKIKEYDFDYAICVIPDIVSDQQILKYSLISYFCTHSDAWKCVYWNDRSLLFLKNLPKFAEIIDNYEYKYFTPFNYYFQKNLIEKGLTEDKAEVQGEVDRKHTEDPNSIFLNNFLVLYRKRLF